MNNKCLVCLQNPKRDNYQFCSKFCTDRVARTAPQLLPVPDDHVMYRDVKTLFVNNWNWSTGHLPQIKRIYLITWSPSLRESFDSYRENVARTMTNKDKPKEVKRFRCEARMCRLGDPGESTALCRMPMCHLCRAIETGFKTTLDYKRSLSPMQQRGVRFGRGIYMAASSSKAFQYASNGDSRSEHQAVLVTRVVLGNPQWLCKEDHKKEKLDKGYHSVEAHPENGGPTEDVVFDHNAVRPAYLIIVKQ